MRELIDVQVFTPPGGTVRPPEGATHVEFTAKGGGAGGSDGRDGEDGYVLAEFYRESGERDEGAQSQTSVTSR